MALYIADDTDIELMEKALAEAEAALNHGCAGVAALLRWKNEILALDHNRFEETRDMTDHGEIAVLRKCARQLSAMSEEEKDALTIYVTLEPCLMCLSAISFVGIKRVVYSALNADATEDCWIARDITSEYINARLVRGPLVLVPGVLREKGRHLLERMGNLA